jgi:hypothetical protein
MKRLAPFLFTVLILLIAEELSAQNKIQHKIPEKTRILFVIDGSGSMEG